MVQNLNMNRFGGPLNGKFRIRFHEGTEVRSYYIFLAIYFGSVSPEQKALKNPSAMEGSWWNGIRCSITGTWRRDRAMLQCFQGTILWRWGWIPSMGEIPGLAAEKRRQVINRNGCIEEFHRCICFVVWVSSDSTMWGPIVMFVGLYTHELVRYIHHKP